MSSVGQAAGYLVGGIVGSFVPGLGTMIGAQIGGMIGGYIDPPKGPKIEGPRLSDLTIQTATYGASIPRVYRKIALSGNIFWLENGRLTESSKTTSAGKGGGGQKSTAYSYSATFALGLCRGPIKGIGRIWCSGKLIYDGGSSDLFGIIASNESASLFTVYPGSSTQLPDPRMQADLGMSNTPAYRDLAYIVFQDFPLGEFGNTLQGAQFKVEVITTDMVYDWTTATRLIDTLQVTFNRNTGYGIGDPYIAKVESGLVYVGIYGSEQSWVFSQFDGSLVDLKLDKAYLETNPANYLYYYAWKQAGRVADGRYLYVCFIGSGIVGYGPIYESPADNFHISGARVDGQVIAHRIANGYPATYLPRFVALDKYDNRIFISVQDTDDWYLVDLDGAILDHGTWHYTGTTRAYGRAGEAVSHGGAGAFATHLDYEAGRLVVASPVNLYIYGIAADRTITQEKYLSDTIGTIGDPFTVFIDKNHVSMISNTDFMVVQYSLVSIAGLPLGYIVAAECLSSGLLTAADIDTSALTSLVKGYKVAETSAIRSALEPLRAAWPFDVVPHGYILKFVPRGGASVSTIDISDLGAVAGGDQPAIRLTQSREMDAQIPRRVELTYLDVEREYDIGEQAAERLNTDAISVTRLELPIVMDANEAAAKAETLLYLYWLERRDVSFILPPPYRMLEVADVITIVGDDETYELRLTEINDLTDGRMECKAKFNQSAIYTASTAQGESGAMTGQVLTIDGPCHLLLLDIPCVNTRFMNAPGILAGLSPLLSGWKGGTIFRSDDNGQSWDAIQSIKSPGTISGTATNVIGAGVTHLIDTANAITCRMHGGVLTSVSDAALFNGANHFAYGANGRWEIIGAKTVAAETDGSYTLSNLMRGRFGTEWAMSLHQTMDALVLLDAQTLRFITLNESAINATRLWRGVSSNQALETAAETAYAYAGVNLKPLAPIWLRGSRNPLTLDWTLECTRRSRTPVEPFSGLPTPVGESAESYVFEIWDSGFSTLKRTLPPVSVPSAIYAQASQLADFGSEPSTVHFKVRQVSPLVGYGYAASASIYHAIGADPLFASLKALVQCSGPEGGTAFADLLGNSITVSGNAHITTSSPIVGTSSGILDGSGDYITLDSSPAFAVGAGDFCLEGFFEFSGFATNHAFGSCLFDLRPAGSYSNGFALFANSSGVITAWDSNSTSHQSTSGKVSSGSRVHVAIDKYSNFMRVFIAGVEVIGYSHSINYNPSTTTLVVGTAVDYRDTSANFKHNGRFGPIRFTGASRYQSNFTPPSSFPES